MRVVGVPVRIVTTVQAMYNDAKSRIRVNGLYSDEFVVKVSVHQGSVMSLLLFVVVLEAQSKEFCTGCPWELHHVDGLALIADTFNKLAEKLEMWKNNLESKGLHVNMSKTKVILCRKGVRRNLIYC